MRIERLLKGKRVKGACKKLSRKAARKLGKHSKRLRSCQTVRALGTLGWKADQVSDAKRWNGSIGSKRLSPGSYRATFVATDEAKNKSEPKTIVFKILR